MLIGSMPPTIGGSGGVAVGPVGAPVGGGLLGAGPDIGAGPGTGAIPPFSALIGVAILRLFRLPMSTL